MSNVPQASINGIMRVAEQLGARRGQVVFLGGAVTGLLLTDPAAPEARYTEDVDVLISAKSRPEYYRWETALEELGFARRRQEGDPICRWTVADVVVDVMPVAEEILGFGNRWYAPALEAATTTTLAEGMDIRIVTTPHFLAMKIEAFRSRGQGDYLFSRDVQDIVAVVDGRLELMEEVRESDQPLRLFLAEAFGSFLAEEAFLDALSGHMLPDAASQRRVPLLMDRCRQIGAITR